MANDNIKNKFVGLNALSGTSEGLRGAIGAVWGINQLVSGSELEYKGKAVTAKSLSDMFGEVTDPTIRLILTDQALLDRDASKKSFVPSYKIPIRIFGNVDVVENDDYWEKYFMGGTFGDATLPGIYSNQIYENTTFEISTPYTAKQKNAFNIINKSYGSDDIKIGYNYNYYLPKYEEYVSNLESPLLIPSVYYMLYYADPPSFSGYDSGINSSIESFVTIDGRYSNVENVLNNVLSQYLPEDASLYTSVQHAGEGDLYLDKIKNAKRYFSQVLSNSTLSSSTTNEVLRLGKNTFFDHVAVQNSLFRANAHIDRFPYYIDISIPNISQDSVKQKYGTDSLIRKMIEYHTPSRSPSGSAMPTIEFSGLFLRMLQNHFELDTSLIKNNTFSRYASYVSASMEEEGAVYPINSVNNNTFRSVDLIEALVANLNNLSPTNVESSYFVNIDGQQISNNLMNNQFGAYRYLNSKLALKFLNKLLTQLKQPNSLFLHKLLSISATTNEAFAYNLYNLAGQTNYNEIIAYRISKIAGPPRGDLRQQEVLQDFWIYNSSESVLNNFFDTQVKYGEEYTYIIYAYLVNVGSRYKTTDIILSRQISSLHDVSYLDDPTIAAMLQEILNGNSGVNVTDLLGAASNLLASQAVCLEFYDPATQQPIGPLATNLEIGRSQIGSLTSEAHIFTSAGNLYQCDMNLNIEPSVQILELPLFQKSIKVLDHPVNNLDVHPFQKLNDSQEIGFFINYESFVSELYPTPISAAEQTQKAEYLNANDIFESQKISIESKSPQAKVRVYRLSEKPTSFTSFDRNLIKEIDLYLPSEKTYKSNCVFYDKIATNQKYYYLFRFLNAHNNIGHFSPIVEAELVNDGGYKYSVFKEYLEEDLKEEIFINPSKSLKKILNIVPNLDQLQLNSESVDFSKPAISQISKLTVGHPGLEDFIWNKRFKLRLTSKKTGKKLDINLKFNIQDGTAVTAATFEGGN